MDFVKQHPLLWVFIRICLLKERPDVLPSSVFLLGILAATNLLLGIINFLLDFDLLQSVLRTLADLSFSLAFVYLLLLAVNKSERLLQTLIAMLGVSAILSSLAFPFLVLLPEERAALSLAGIALYGLFFWHLIVIGNIFRHALSVGFATGIVVSMVYVLTAMSLFYSLFPVQ